MIRRQIRQHSLLLYYNALLFIWGINGKKITDWFSLSWVWFPQINPLSILFPRHLIYGTNHNLLELLVPGLNGEDSCNNVDFYHAWLILYTPAFPNPSTLGQKLSPTPLLSSYISLLLVTATVKISDHKCGYTPETIQSYGIRVIIFMSLCAYKHITKHLCV